MATELMGFEIGTLSAWLVWILPFAAALIIPGVGKLSKHATQYVAVGFAFDERIICSIASSSGSRGT